MTKYLALLGLLFFFTSCSNDSPVVDPADQLKNTTVEIQNMVAKDTVLYKVVYYGQDLYCINTTTNLVEYKLGNYSGATGSLTIVLLALILIPLLWGIIVSE